MFNEWFERSRYRIITNRYEFVKKTMKCDREEINVGNYCQATYNGVSNIIIIPRDTENSFKF